MISTTTMPAVSIWKSLQEIAVIKVENHDFGYCLVSEDIYEKLLWVMATDFEAVKEYFEDWRYTVECLLEKT